MVAPGTLGACWEMPGSGFRAILVIAAASLILPTAGADAEVSLDLYVGGTYTDADHISQTSSLGSVITYSDVKFDSAATFGLRAGYWFERPAWLGFGVDVFQFNSNLSQQTVRVSGAPISTVTLQEVEISTTAIALDIIRLRLLLLRSGHYPRGRLQPYLTAGPAIFLTRFEDSSNLSPPNQSKRDVVLGFKVGAGAAFHLTPHFALFGEYRLTSFSPEATFQVAPTASSETFNTDIATHHLVAGVSLRF